MRRYERDQYTNAERFWTVLSAAERDEGTKIGALRYLNARRKGAQHRAGFGSREADERGGRCELGTAKILDQPWNVPFSTSTARINAHADVGGYQVRGMARPDGRLIIRPRDDDEQPFILALESRHNLGDLVTVKIQLLGWAFAGAAKRDEWWWCPRRSEGANAAWFMPQSHLEAMKDLPVLSSSSGGERG